ncbi:hypothetical protein HMI54_015164 [Coelomomyces lativittatus]|nr:hypothetical protein HMI56_003597 [Coelomomyces lativittatus]KAJ1513207.1 hypothetical protein HMI54_015164 [Coelomomyces lativittatus]KAJ1513241.1 hypothetical protein HMI55_005776 [Coelomomyces lativittatus]
MSAPPSKDKNVSEDSAGYTSYIQLENEAFDDTISSPLPFTTFTDTYHHVPPSTFHQDISSGNEGLTFLPESSTYLAQSMAQLPTSEMDSFQSRRLSVQSTSILLSPKQSKDYSMFEPGTPMMQRVAEPKFCCCVPARRKKCCQITLFVLFLFSIVFALVFYFFLLPFTIRYSFENVAADTLLKFIKIPDDGDPAKLPLKEAYLSFLVQEPGFAVRALAVGPTINFLFFKLFVNPATWSISAVDQGRTSTSFIQIKLPSLQISYPGTPELPLNVTVNLPSFQHLGSFINGLMSPKGLTPETGKISLSGDIDYYTYGLPMRPVHVDRHIDFSGYHLFSFFQELSKFLPKNYTRFKGFKLNFGAEGNDFLLNLGVRIDNRIPLFFLLPAISVKLHVAGEPLMNVKISPIDIKNGDYELSIKVRASFTLSLDELIKKVIQLGLKAIQDKAPPKMGLIPPVYIASIPTDPNSPPLSWVGEMTKSIALDLPLDLLQIQFSGANLDISKLIKIKVSTAKDSFPALVQVGEGVFSLPSSDLASLSGSINLYSGNVLMLTLGFANVSLNNGLQLSGYAKLFSKSASQWESLVHLQTPFDFFVREIFIGSNPYFPNFNFRIPIPADPVEALVSLVSSMGSGMSLFNLPLRDLSLMNANPTTLSIKGMIVLPFKLFFSILVDLPISFVFGISSGGAGRNSIVPLELFSIPAKFDLSAGVPFDITLQFLQDDAAQAAFASFFTQPQAEMVVSSFKIGEVTSLSDVRWIRFSMQTFKKLFSIAQGLLTGNRQSLSTNDPYTKLILRLYDILTSEAKNNDMLGAQSFSPSKEEPDDLKSPSVTASASSGNQSSSSLPASTSLTSTPKSSISSTSSVASIPVTSFNSKSTTSPLAITASSFSSDFSKPASITSAFSSPVITPSPKLNNPALYLDSILKKRDLSSKLPSFLTNLLKSPLLSLIKSVYLGPSKATPGAVEFFASIHLPSLPFIKEITLPNVGLKFFFNQVHILSNVLSISSIRPSQPFEVNAQLTFSSDLAKAWPSLSFQTLLISFRELKLGQVVTFQRAHIDFDLKALLGGLISLPANLGFNLNSLGSLNLNAINGLLDKLPFKIQAEVEGSESQPQFITKIEVEFFDIPIEYMIHFPFQIALKFGQSNAPSTMLLRLFADPKITRGAKIAFQVTLEFNSQPQVVDGVAKFASGQSNEILTLTDLQFMGCSSLASIQFFSLNQPRLLSLIQSLLSGLGNSGSSVPSNPTGSVIKPSNGMTSGTVNNPILPPSSRAPSGPATPPPTSPGLLRPSNLVPALVSPLSLPNPAVQKPGLLQPAANPPLYLGQNPVASNPPPNLLNPPSPARPPSQVNPQLLSPLVKRMALPITSHSDFINPVSLLRRQMFSDISPTPSMNFPPIPDLASPSSTSANPFSSSSANSGFSSSSNLPLFPSIASTSSSPFSSATSPTSSFDISPLSNLPSFNSSIFNTLSSSSSVPLFSSISSTSTSSSSSSSLPSMDFPPIPNLASLHSSSVSAFNSSSSPLLFSSISPSPSLSSTSSSSPSFNSTKLDANSSPSGSNGQSSPSSSSSSPPSYSMSFAALASALSLPPFIVSFLSMIQQCDIQPLTDANQGLSIQTVISIPKFPIVTKVSLPPVTLSAKLNQLEIVTIRLAPIKIILSEQKFSSLLEIRFSTSPETQQSLASFSLFKPFHVGVGGLSIGVATTFSKFFIALPVNLPNPLDALTSNSAPASTSTSMSDSLNTIIKILNLKDIQVKISDSEPTMHITSFLGALPLPFNFNFRIPLVLSAFVDVNAPSSVPFMKVSLDINAKNGANLNVPILVVFSAESNVKEDLRALVSGTSKSGAVDPALSVGGIEIANAKLFSTLRVISLRRSQIISMISKAMGSGSMDPMKLLSMFKNLRMEPSENRPGYNIELDILIPPLPLPITQILTPTIQASVRLFGIPILKSILSPNTLEPQKGSFRQSLSAVFDNSDEVIQAVTKAQNRILAIGLGGLVLGGITSFDASSFDLTFDLGNIPQTLLQMIQNPSGPSPLRSILGNMDLKNLIVLKSVAFSKESPVLQTQVVFNMPPQIFKLLPVHYLNIGPNVFFLNTADRFFIASKLSSIVITPSAPSISLLSKLEFSNAEESQAAVAAWVRSILGRSNGYVKLTVTGLQFAAENMPVKTLSGLYIELPIKEILDIFIFGAVGSKGDLLIAIIDKITATPQAPSRPPDGAPLLMNFFRNIFLQQKTDSPSYDFVSDMYMALPSFLSIPSLSVDYYYLKLRLDVVDFVSISASSPLLIAGNGNLRVAANALFSNANDALSAFAALVRQLLGAIGGKGIPAGVREFTITDLVFGGGTPQSNVFTFQKLPISISVQYLFMKFVVGKIRMPSFSLRDLLSLPRPSLKFDGLFKVTADIDIPVNFLPIPVALDLGSIFVNVYLGDMIVANVDIPEIRKPATSRVLSVVGTKVSILPNSNVGGGLLSNIGTFFSQGLGAISISDVVLLPPSSRGTANANSVRTFAMAKFKLP